MLGQKNFLDRKKDGSRKNLGPKKVLGQKNFQVQNFFGVIRNPNLLNSARIPWVVYM